MIPKVIHYCWFGRGKKSAKIESTIEMWRRRLPDYAIKEWNEDNFDVGLNEFVAAAYRSRLFAFVADVARLYALKTDGGIYLDTDVEVLRPFDEFLGHEAFLGYESWTGGLNSGTIGSVPNGRMVSDLLLEYDSRSFEDPNGKPRFVPNTRYFEAYFRKMGCALDGKYHSLCGLATIYPFDYFCAYHRIGMRVEQTENTFTIHRYMGSWNPWRIRVVKWIVCRIGVFPARCVSLILKGPFYAVRRICVYWRTGR